jgi:hypothetical protein
VRRQAAVDGKLIDPWPLAAVLQGFRLRMDGALRIIDRGAVLDAARHALMLHQWIVTPDFDEEGEVQQAERHLAGVVAAGDTPLLAAARGVHAWLDSGGTRPPIRAALVRFWMRRRVLRVPVPLTGPAALRAETPFELSAWLPAFLRALATEAANGRQLLMDLERAWFATRSAVAGRRRDSHIAAAVDVQAAVPLVSATTLAAGLGVAVKTAIRLMDDLVISGVAVEVTHRAKRRLFGLKGMAPLGDAVRPPYRPEPGRGRGRPPIPPVEDDVVGPPLPPLTPVERRAFDYSDLEHWVPSAMAVRPPPQCRGNGKRALLPRDGKAMSANADPDRTSSSDERLRSASSSILRRPCRPVIIVEQDHRRIKRLTRTGLGFGGFWTARRTLAGYETMAMIRKGQVRKVGGGDISAQSVLIAELFEVAA